MTSCRAFLPVRGGEVHLSFSSSNHHFIISNSFIRFAIVGVINTIVGTAIMFVLYNVFDCSYWLSSAANYFFGSILSYCLNRWYTFKYHGSTWRSIVKFTINIVVCYFIAYGVAKPLAKAALSDSSKSLQENVAMAVGMVLFVLLNYLGQRFFAFKKEKKTEEAQKA